LLTPSFQIHGEASINKIFSVLESSKETLQIAQYSVRQTSLEQIFNSFAQAAEREANQQQQLQQ